MTADAMAARAVNRASVEARPLSASDLLPAAARANTTAITMNSSAPSIHHHGEKVGRFTTST